MADLRLQDPLFDGVFFDCACGHPKNASAFGDAAYAAGYEQVWQKVNAALAAKGRWGTAWAGPNVLNPTVNTAGQNKVCKDLMPKIIATGQANGTSQFQWVYVKFRQYLLCFGRFELDVRGPT